MRQVPEEPHAYSYELCIEFAVVVPGEALELVSEVAVTALPLFLVRVA